MNKLFRMVKDHSVILVNAGSLIGTAAITSGLGFAYWWLAARIFSPQVVGLASAIISAMSLLGSFAVLGMGTLLIKELASQREKAFSLISTALLLVGVVGGCVGVIYAVTASNLSPAFRVLGESSSNVVLFALGVSLAAITLVLDQALIGLLRGELQLWRNAIFSIVKLGALFAVSLWVSQATGLTIYATWVLGMSSSLLVMLGFVVARRKKPGRLYRLQWGWLRKLGPEALKHHVLNLTLDAPSLLLPMVVTLTLSAVVNAWFYVAWSLGGVANTAAGALATTLYAVGAAQPEELARKLRLTIGLSLAACVLTNCVLLIAPAQVLALFGHSYSVEAAWSLRFLSLESFPFIIKNHYIALSRIRGQLTRTIAITVMTGVLELGGSALGAHIGGLNGLSLGWLGAVTIEAVCMLPTVYRATWVVKTSADSLKEQKTYEEDAVWLIETFVTAAVSTKMLETTASLPSLRIENRRYVSGARREKIRPRRTRLEYILSEEEQPQRDRVGAGEGSRIIGDG